MGNIEGALNALSAQVGKPVLIIMVRTLRRVRLASLIKIEQVRPFSAASALRGSRVFVLLLFSADGQMRPSAIRDTVSFAFELHFTTTNPKFSSYFCRTDSK